MGQIEGREVKESDYGARRMAPVECINRPLQLVDVSAVGGKRAE